MMSAALDIFRLRQYFDVAVGVRDVARGLADDLGLLDDVRRALVELPVDRWPDAPVPFPAAVDVQPLRGLEGRRVAIACTGGSGALAAVVGVTRAFEDAGVRPALISTCSGSALFGFPVACGLPAHDVARFVLSLRPRDLVDVDAGTLGSAVLRAGTGFGGVIRGDRLEATYRRLLGDRTLGELAIPAYAPIWNVETNRVAFLGPRTHPELPVARAVHHAIALPLFFQPVELDGGAWCDGGIVDIFPIAPITEFEPPCDGVVAVNCFYPPGFAGEDETGWQDRPLSILDIASQVRTCQQAALAREHLAELRARVPVAMIEPVPYEVVQGVGFYRQFLSTRDWAGFMVAGREHGAQALRALAARLERTDQPVG